MTIYSQISSNKLKSYLLMLVFILLFGGVAYVIGRTFGFGLSFVGIMLIISGAMSFTSYYYSDKIVLSMSGAKQIKKKDNPYLYNMVENLSIASGLPMPRVYVVNDPAPNAFATGRDPKHAAVAATTGIIERLENEELEGVIGHELSHVKNFDTRLMGIVSILAGSIAILSDFFLRSLFWGNIGGRDNNRSNGNGYMMIFALIAAILAPIAAMLIQFSISRKREFLADADGALLTRYPEGLASALEKISQDRNVLKSASNATAHLYFENPFKTDSGKKTKSFLAGLFSTHPPVAERVKALRSM